MASTVFCGLGWGKARADFGDAPILNGDVSFDRRATGSVENQGVLDQGIPLHDLHFLLQAERPRQESPAGNRRVSERLGERDIGKALEMWIGPSWSLRT